MPPAGRIVQQSRLFSAHRPGDRSHRLFAQTPRIWRNPFIPRTVPVGQICRPPHAMVRARGTARRSGLNTAVRPRPADGAEDEQVESFEYRCRYGLGGGLGRADGELCAKSPDSRGWRRSSRRRWRWWLARWRRWRLARWRWRLARRWRRLARRRRLHPRRGRRCDHRWRDRVGALRLLWRPGLLRAGILRRTTTPRLRWRPAATMRWPTACRPIVPTIRGRAPISAMTVTGTPARKPAVTCSMREAARTVAPPLAFCVVTRGGARQKRAG